MIEDEAYVTLKKSDYDQLRADASLGQIEREREKKREKEENTRKNLELAESEIKELIENNFTQFKRGELVLVVHKIDPIRDFPRRPEHEGTKYKCYLEESELSLQYALTLYCNKIMNSQLAKIPWWIKKIFGATKNKVYES